MSNTNSSSTISENRFTALIRIVVGVFIFTIMTILTMTAFLHTTGMEVVEEGNGCSSALYWIQEGLESVIYYNDNFILNVVWLALMLLICFTLMPVINKLPLKAELPIISAIVIISGIVWVNSALSAPSEDSVMVTNASFEFAHNDFTRLTGEERYFKNYSFQLGYVLFNEIIIRIRELFGKPENLLYLEHLNVIFLTAAYIGILLIVDMIFEDKRIRHLTGLFMVLAAAPIMFTTFLYGIIPGFCAGVWAVFFLVKFLKAEKRKWQCIYGILCALLITLAVMIKSNNLIILVAVCIMAAAGISCKKRIVPNILLIVFSTVLSVSVSPMVKSMYESRSGTSLGDAVPFVSWFSMGLDESSNAPGWYNYVHTLSNFENSNFDADVAAEKSKEHIKERVKDFLEHPQYANDFFYKKFTSQWNETSYQSIWTNRVRQHYGDYGKIAHWVILDNEYTVKKLLDVFAQLIFFGMLMGSFFMFRDKRILTVIFPLIIVGGVMYHLLAEAKSQYSLPYFILMFGFAAYGICGFYDRLPEKARKIIRRFQFVRDTVPVTENAEVDVTESDKADEKPETPAESKKPAEKTEAPAESKKSAEKAKQKKKNKK